MELYVNIDQFQIKVIIRYKETIVFFFVKSALAGHEITKLLIYLIY